MTDTLISRMLCGREVYKWVGKCGRDVQAKSHPHRGTGGGGGLMRSLLYKMRYIWWVAVLLGACDVIQDVGHFGRHLGFYRKLEIVKNR